MKDFIKWLGVNEKVAKVAVWMLIVMIFLVIINTFLESIGLPYYSITYDNLIKINMNQTVGKLLNCLITVLNFYTIVLLIFPLKETKKITKYALLYLILTWVITETLNYAALQVFIIGYCIVFSYFYSNKNWRYIFYTILSIILNMVIQTIWYSVKASFIDYVTLNGITRTILTVDYFIIMAIIILVKEIYFKKRRNKNG